VDNFFFHLPLITYEVFGLINHFIQNKVVHNGFIPQIYEVFGLMNHSIQNKVVCHGSIPQIWWDNSIPHISTKQLTMRNEVVMD
jgi:hypothetical protein